MAAVTAGIPVGPPVPLGAPPSSLGVYLYIVITSMGPLVPSCSLRRRSVCSGGCVGCPVFFPAVRWTLCPERVTRTEALALEARSLRLSPALTAVRANASVPSELALSCLAYPISCKAVYHICFQPCALLSSTRPAKSPAFSPRSLPLIYKPIPSKDA